MTYDVNINAVLFSCAGGMPVVKIRKEIRNMYKIHFTDAYGSATLECDTYQEFTDAYANIRKDPLCEDIWCEELDPEEGWQAL